MFARLSAAVFLAAMGAGAGAADAQTRDPGSYARMMNQRGGGVILDANYLSARGCDRVVDFRHGAPVGERVDRDATAYTIVIDIRDQSCGRRGPRVVRHMRGLSPRVPGNIHLFFISTGGAVLKRELIAIPA